MYNKKSSTTRKIKREYELSKRQKQEEEYCRLFPNSRRYRVTDLFKDGQRLPRISRKTSS